MTYLFHCDPRSVADDGDEMSIQVRLRRRVKDLMPTVSLIAIPNAAQRSAWSAAKAKAEGMAKGFPDLHAIWSNGIGVAAVPGVAYLELKTRTGSLSAEQVDWLNRLHRMGHPCGCFRSVDTAVVFLRQHGAPFMAEATNG